VIALWRPIYEDDFMVIVTLRKKNSSDRTNWLLVIRCENNILFENRIPRVLGGGHYNAVYSRGCGAKCVSVVSRLLQAKTIASLIYSCRNSGLELKIEIPQGHVMHTVSDPFYNPGGDFVLESALNESDVDDLFKHVESEMETIEREINQTPHYYGRWTIDYSKK
jgi:hypothetical protein